MKKCVKRLRSLVRGSIGIVPANRTFAYFDDFQTKYVFSDFAATHSTARDFNPWLKAKVL
jgi:hypothetical protein